MNYDRKVGELPTVDYAAYAWTARIDDAGGVWVKAQQRGYDIAPKAPTAFGLNPSLFEGHNRPVPFCIDQAGVKWSAQKVNGCVLIHSSGPERLNGPSITDALPDIRAAAKTFRDMFQTAKTELRRLGTEIGKAAFPAILCQARLKEQLQAGGVDSEFDRESIRRRVSAELFMVGRVFDHIEDLNTFGEEFRRTVRDVPEIPF